VVGQALRGLLPRLSGVARPVDAEPAVRRHAVLVRLLGDDERRVGIARVERDREAEPAWQTVAVQALPAVAAVVRAVGTEVVLLPEPLGLMRVQKQLVHALPDLRILVGKIVGGRALVGRRPRLAAVFAAEDSRRGDPDVHALRIGRVDLDRVAAHSTGAGLPLLAGGMLEDALHHVPGGAAVT
jgi:hypothetical protein